MPQLTLTLPSLLNTVPLLLLTLPLLHAQSTTEPVTTASPYTSALSSSSATPSPVPEYTILYPSPSTGNILVNYKDNLTLSWSLSNIDVQAPVIDILCWNRSAVTSPQFSTHPPDLTTLLTLPASRNETSYTFSLLPYKQYDPCQITLSDNVDSEREHTAQPGSVATSAPIEIQIDEGAGQKVWNASARARVAGGWGDSTGGTEGGRGKGRGVLGLGLVAGSVAVVVAGIGGL